MADEIDFFDAYDSVLIPMFTASNVLRLVAGASASGLMTALRDPASTADLAAKTGLAETRVSAVCRALVAAGVAQQDGERLRLSPAWHALTDPGAFVPLELALQGNYVEGQLMAASAGETYWSITAEDRLSYARSVSPNPYSSELVDAFRRQIPEDPDRAAMAEGGRLLELGCGVAGRVLTTLRAMPRLSAVGVELSPDLAAEAERRARDLGLSDRFRVACVDAAEFTDPEPFDFGFWSQFFFPEESRQGALRTMLSSLRPGGVVLAPLGADYDAIQADPDSTAAREYALWRVVLDSWGVPERSPETLVAEVQSAGFVDVRVVAGGAGPVVRATRP
ncbi:MAG TPA: class I SAM-dependent methyltransferase [Jatrophihabitantaceae bacterium]|nr:class I SAM-dependent methyltransferase [Jatrophihabitantaceae bacterium]